jgi:hypothetical protein
MVIQIRVVIDVPEKDKENFQAAIENIIEAIKAQFPDLKTTRMNSPVTVTIKDLEKDG